MLDFDGENTSAFPLKSATSLNQQSRLPSSSILYFASVFNRPTLAFPAAILGLSLQCFMVSAVRAETRVKSIVYAV
ncbi:hypothetical protein V6N13_145102 [Hibiscus sabdariffa]|uniref:Uncharacterized protein n=1 Tax=Hibiscus sabdariffa TaxID=183260 RepID=A0ABR2FMB8_9ROSI